MSAYYSPMKLDPGGMAHLYDARREAETNPMPLGAGRNLRGVG